MQIYSKSMKNATSLSFSWPILILFGLSDRAWCGLQNFYTEFRNSLIMQIYANLFKINEKCYFSVISWPVLIMFVLSDRAWWGLRNFYTELWNSLIMQIYSKSMKNAASPLFRNHNRSALEGGDVYYASRNFTIHLLALCFRPFCAFHTKMSAHEVLRVISIQRSKHHFWSWNGNLITLQAIFTNFLQLTIIRNAYALKKVKTRIYKKCWKLKFWKHNFSLTNL